MFKISGQAIISKKEENQLESHQGLLFEDPNVFIERVTDNIQKIISLIDSMDQIVETNKLSPHQSDLSKENKESNLETLPSTEETGVTARKLPPLNMKKVNNYVFILIFI